MMTLHNVSYKINEPQKAQERQQIGSSFFFSLFLFSSFLFFFFFCFSRWRLRETFEYTCKVGVRDTEKDGVKQQGWTERIQGTDREKPREREGGRERRTERGGGWLIKGWVDLNFNAWPQARWRHGTVFPSPSSVSWSIQGRKGVQWTKLAEERENYEANCKGRGQIKGVGRRREQGRQKKCVRIGACVYAAKERLKGEFQKIRGNCVKQPWLSWHGTEIRLLVNETGD